MLTDETLSAVYNRKTPPFSTLALLFLSRTMKTTNREVEAEFGRAVLACGNWWPKRKPSVADMYDDHVTAFFDLFKLNLSKAEAKLVEDRAAVVHHALFQMHQHELDKKLKRRNVMQNFPNTGVESFIEQFRQHGSFLSPEQTAGLDGWCAKVPGLSTDDWRTAWIELRRLLPDDPINAY